MSSEKSSQSAELIQFIGLNELTPDEQKIIKTISQDSHDKIRRKLNNITNMSVHVKAYSKEGSKKKYSMHVKVAAPTHVFDSSNMEDWDLPTAMHMAIESILHQIQHRLHNDRTRPDA